MTWKIWWAVWKWLWETAKYTWDLANAAVKWVVKIPIELLDMAWDVASNATDFTTNLVTGWRWTNLSNKEWFLDKARDASIEFIDEYWTSNLSDFSKTDAGKLWLDAAEFLSWFVVPVGWTAAKVWQVYNKLKTVKWWAKVAKELESLFDAARAGKKVDQSQIDNIFAKYSKNPEFIKKWKETLTADVLESKKIADVFKKIQNTPIKEIQKNPRLLTMYNWMKKNPKKTLGWWVSALALGWYLTWDDENTEAITNAMNTPIEMAEKEPEVVKYKDREVIQLPDWRFTFVGKSINPQITYGSMEEMQRDIDSKLNTYYQDEYMKAIASKDEVKLNEIIERAKERGIDVERLQL